MKKVGIVGVGRVGSTIAYSLTEDTGIDEMILVAAHNSKAVGEASDIIQGLPFKKNIRIRAGEISDIKNVDIVILSFGAPEKIGESRYAPMLKNIEILKSIIKVIIENNPDCILVVISNPVDIMTYAATRISGFPKNRVIGLGTLIDDARLKSILSEELQVSDKSIHTYVIGEHGQSPTIVWSLSDIAGIDINKAVYLVDKPINKFSLQSVNCKLENMAFKVWEQKGANTFCIADATRRLVTAILRDEHVILPVSTLLEGEYGLENLCLSVMAIIGRDGVIRTIEQPISDDEKAQLYNSADHVLDIIRDNKQLWQN